MIPRRYQLLLLALIIFAAYSPSLTAGFSAIDDYSQIARYSGVKEWKELPSYIVPSGGLYFRPLTASTFFADKVLHGFNPSWMHRENVFLHFINAVLVYFLAVNLLSSAVRNTTSYIPFVAALLFGLHPVNTESVSWISGRYDILALTFILSSALFLMLFKSTGMRKYLLLSLLAMLAGAFAKETALAFVPGFILIAASRDDDKARNSLNERKVQLPVLNREMGLIIGSIVIVFLGFMVRSGDFVVHKSRMYMTLTFIFNDWMHTMFVVLRAFGFYMKKLIFPFPLNASIMDIDPFYDIVGVPLLALCIYAATKKNRLSAVFTAGVLLIAPSFILAFNQIAWTPYAERYVYMTSAFFVPVAVIYVSRQLDYVKNKNWFNITVGVLAVILFIAVFQRSGVWKDNLALAMDSVKKSPYSPDMRLLYGGLLEKKGNYDEALRQLEQGKNIHAFGYASRFAVGIASVYEAKGERDKAIKICKEAFSESRGTSEPVLTLLVELLEKKKQNEHSNRVKKEIDRELLGYTLQLFKINHDPHLLYRLGIISSDSGEKEKAKRYFQQAYNLSYDKESKKLAESKIENLSGRKKERRQE